MRIEAIPVHAVPLSAEQAGAMAQLRIKKHHVAIMLLHWFNAIVWLLELLTGLTLISSDYFRVVPLWYVSIAQGAFGGRANMLQFHVALGLVWIVVFLVYFTFGYRTYLGEVLHKEIALDRDDFRWLIVRTLRILGRSNEALPPQGSYNAGQKLFAFMIYAMIPVVMVSGVIMAFRLFSPAAVGWAIVAHFAAVGAVVSGLMVHVYMGAVFPEEKSAFFSMITGTVDELYAYSHHFKWWREVKVAQAEWEQRHDRERQRPADTSGTTQAVSGSDPGGSEVPGP
ncbi:MAG: cytochrome b/b6 domain-containing protein [Vicinamibacteria bacterium]|nr:cytochrome b/b6 domain-containing protein [Vicinamibacteria bacterium]